MNPQRGDLVQTTLGVLFIGGLLFASFRVLRPFLGAVIWATMIVVATWPAFRALEARLRNRRFWAVAVMMVLLMTGLVVPLFLAIATLLDNAERMLAWAAALKDVRVPPPPDWVASVPVVGDALRGFWDQVAAAGINALAAKLAPYASDITKWFLAEAGSFGMLLVHLVLTVIMSAILFAGGDGAAEWLKRFGRRLAGPRGQEAVVLAGQAIRGVALGVVVTAVVQSVLGGIGLAIAGVPLVAVLTAFMFMLSIAQIGPMPVLVPAVVWLYWSGETGWGSFLLAWTVVVGSLDNLLRPILIKKGANLPLLLVFAGVIGGMITLGLIGIFVGPVVLAVTYTLIDAWVREDPRSA